MKNIFVLLVTLMVINTGFLFAGNSSSSVLDKVIPTAKKVVPANKKVVPEENGEATSATTTEATSLEVLFNDELIENDLYQMEFGDVKFVEAYKFAKTANKRLDKIADFLVENQDLFMNIIGYTDNQYNGDWSLKIGMERAKLCYDYLVEKGVRPEQLTFTSKGKEFPVASNAKKESRVLNNRVEFELKE